MATQLRVFEVPRATPGTDRPIPVEHRERYSIPENGDKAKLAAHLNLRRMGYTVRSVNWSPTIVTNVHELVAYVTKES